MTDTETTSPRDEAIEQMESVGGKAVTVLAGRVVDAILADADLSRSRELVLAQPRSLLPASIEDLEQSARIIAYGGTAPVALQGNPERCIGIAYQAALRRIDPVAFASECYVMPVKGGGERLCFMAKLIKALIMRDVPFELGKELRIEYVGEGAQRYAIARGTPLGTTRELIYTSPIFGQITPKNSPLWFSDPDLQFDYFASMRWARKHRPDVIMGMYTPDEMQMMAGESSTSPRKSPYAPQIAQAADGSETLASPADGDISGASVDVSADPPPPSGGRGVVNKDDKSKATKAGNTKAADIGPNPWPDVDDIMEWLEAFKIEAQGAPDRAALAKLYETAKAHGLTGRLKKASATDHADLIKTLDALNVELKAKEEIAT